MPKKILTQNLKNLFHQTKSSPYWEKMKTLHPILRYALAIGLILFGVLGIFTPIPAGVIFLIFGLALILGLRRVRGTALAFIHFTRLHILYGRIYMWWHMRKR